MERIKIGTVLIDSGVLTLGDPAHAAKVAQHVQDMADGVAEYAMRGEVFHVNDYGALGVVCDTGGGDGAYPVWADVDDMDGRVLALHVNFAREDRMPIEDLGLTARSYNCLQSEGIFTVGDLIARSGLELLDIRQFGATSLRDVEEKLAELNLALRPDVDHCRSA